MPTQRTISVGGGKITLGEDCWLTIEGEERAAIWLSLDDLAKVRELFDVFVRLAAIRDEK